MRTTPKAAGLGKKGFTLIELVAAIAVSAILGVILVSTVQTGIASYKNVNADMMSETEARAALSLVTVQIRQHDVTGGISVQEDKLGMTFYDEPNDADSAYSEIEFRAGTLEEPGKLVAIKYVDGEAAETVIAEINSFYVEYIEPDLNAFSMPAYLIKITYGENGRVLAQTVVQRSAAPSPGGSEG